MKNPIRLFDRWFRQAKKIRGLMLPEAMCVSTVGLKGDPEGRVILLKGYNARGFVFYTNLRSPKSSALKRRPVASLTFYWEGLRRQVRITGRVQPVSTREADDYFRTRPRGSQIAAWASNQSRPIQNRNELLDRVTHFKKIFAGKEVPRPDFWSGWRVVPSRMEFWQEQPSRLHDRFLYVKRKNSWKITRLAP